MAITFAIMPTKICSTIRTSKIQHKLIMQNFYLSG